MSIKHVVHVVGIPGLPGSGISAPDALSLRSDVNDLLIDIQDVYTKSQVDALIAAAISDYRPTGKSIRLNVIPNMVFSTTGTRQVDVYVEFTGLDPAREYTVDGTVSVRTIGSNARSLDVAMQTVGATTKTTFGSAGGEVVSVANVTRESRVIDTVYPNGSGVIRVYPAVWWGSGTVTIDFAHVAATIY